MTLHPDEIKKEEYNCLTCGSIVAINGENYRCDNCDDIGKIDDLIKINELIKAATKMAEKCDIRCEHYIPDIEICLTVGAKSPCYRKIGDDCVAPSLKNVKSSELEQLSKFSEHPFGEWGNAPLDYD